MSKLRLPRPAHAYRFDLLLEFVKRIAYPARMLAQGDVLWRFTGGQLLAYRATPDAILASGASPSASNSDRIRRLSLRCLGLCRDLSDFYRFAQSDAALWRVVEPLVGLPVFCTETVFEALITLIIEQHITWKTALRSQRELMSLFSAGRGVAEQRVYDFPSSEQLAALEPVQLKSLKITHGRSALIIDIARAVGRGDLDLESLRHQEPEDAYEYLMQIKGVGHWTASNAIGRAFGVYPFVSQNDVALQAALRHYFFGGDGLKSAESVLEELGKYGEYAGLAAHFLLLRWVLDRYPSLSPAQ